MATEYYKEFICPKCFKKSVTFIYRTSADADGDSDWTDTYYCENCDFRISSWQPESSSFDNHHQNELQGLRFRGLVSELSLAMKFLSTAPSDVRARLSNLDPRKQLLSWAQASRGRALEGCDLAAKVLQDVDQVIAPFAGSLWELTNMISTLQREAEETQAWLDMRNEEHPTWVPNLDGYLNNLWEGAASTLEKAIRDLEVVRLAPTAEAHGITSILHPFDLKIEQRHLESLSPEEFELFVADRLEAMGLEPVQIGHTNSPDGGIDIIAVPRKSTDFPFLLAVQVKHHTGKKKVGTPDVQRFIGTVITNPFVYFGMIVTNTSFVPNAKIIAQKCPKIILLRGYEHLRRWIKGEFKDIEWREIPETVLLGKLQVKIPRP